MSADGHHAVPAHLHTNTQQTKVDSVISDKLITFDKQAAKETA